MPLWLHVPATGIQMCRSFHDLPLPFQCFIVACTLRILSNIDRASWKHVFFFTIQLMWTAYRYLLWLIFLNFLDVLLPYLCELHYIFIFLSLSKQFVNKLVLTKYFLSINTTDKRTFKKINLIHGSRKIKRENILNLNLQYFFIIAITLFMSGKMKHLFFNVHRHLLYRVLYKRTNGSTLSASASRSDFSLYFISRETGHLLDFFPPHQRNIWSGARSRVRVCRSPKDNGGRWGPGSNRYLA